MKFTLKLAGPMAKMVEAVAAERGISLQEAVRAILGAALEVSGWTSPSDPTVSKALAGRDVPGFVYLFRHSRENHLFKIGFSSNPERRRLEVERTEDCSVAVIATIPTSDMRRLEADLHREHARKRIRGEWFQLSVFDVEAIRRLAERQS